MTGNDGYGVRRKVGGDERRGGPGWGEHWKGGHSERGKAKTACLVLGDFRSENKCGAFLRGFDRVSCLDMYLNRDITEVEGTGTNKVAINSRRGGLCVSSSNARL
jgi:hypothetical protein